jgi:hypothetical protein
LHHQDNTAHLCCCHNCASKLEFCPMCRQTITHVTRVFTI